MKIYNLNTLAHQELVSSATGEKYSKFAVLSEHFGFQDIFVHNEILLPGRRASVPHSHALREEMVVILLGQPLAHVGNQVSQLKPGDIVGFNPGSPALHFIENTTDEIVGFLVICSNPQGDSIIHD